jgi:NitT/TauT family transport system ATP-binding protein
LDLRVGRGEFVAIVGPSGCGKSTLLKAAAGLVYPSAGELTVSGQALGAGAGTVNDVAFVFQAPTLLLWRTVLGNVELPMELRGADRRVRRHRARELLELVGLDEFSDRFPSELSGGMQMRVSLARALTTRPEIMLLDEPFGALDDLTRQRLNEDLTRIWMHEGWTALFVTHNVAEAVFLAQRVLVMSTRPGRILAEVAVDLPFPRLPEARTGARFAQAVRNVSACLEEDS